MKNSRLMLPFCSVITFALALCLSLTAMAGTKTVQVDSHVGPWAYTNGGLNTGFQYGIGEQTAPVVIDSSSGFLFTPGSQFAIQSWSGLVSAETIDSETGLPYGFNDANGYKYLTVGDDNGSTGHPFPSRYFGTREYPAPLISLVGTFTNSSGSIIGSRSRWEWGLSTAVPTGATRLQLGINDDFFLDNQGSFTVAVSGARAVTLRPLSTFNLTQAVTLRPKQPITLKPETSSVATTKEKATLVYITHGRNSDSTAWAMEWLRTSGRRLRRSSEHLLTVAVTLLRFTRPRTSSTN